MNKEPEELSRELGKILGSKPFTIDERDRINEAFGKEGVNSFEDLPDDIRQLLDRPLPNYRKPNGETRASRLSTVERRIIKDSDQCPLCVANNDPKKVPVHPNCHCDVLTDSVEIGVADPESRLLQLLRNTDIPMDLIGEGELPAAIQVNPATVAINDIEDVRFADLTRWLEQIQPYLEQTGQYITMVIDEDTEEAVAQIEELAALAAEDSQQIIEGLRTGKLWFSIAQAVAV